MNRNTSQDQIHHFPRPFLLLATMTAGRTAKELWWMDQEFSSVDVTPGGRAVSLLVAAVQRYSHPMDMINQSINVSRSDITTHMTQYFFMNCRMHNANDEYFKHFISYRLLYC
jgi:hypothetical protein